MEFLLFLFEVLIYDPYLNTYIWIWNKEIYVLWII